MEINVQGYKLESCAKIFCLLFYLIGRKIFSCVRGRIVQIFPPKANKDWGHHSVSGLQKSSLMVEKWGPFRDPLQTKDITAIKADHFFPQVKAA